LYVELQVLDESDTIALKYPAQFPQAPSGCMHFMANTRPLAPGRYSVYVAVYDAETGIALSPQSKPDAERLFLFEFTE
jgi:hypothetical protein